jgi:hypothetical protein
MIGFVAMTLLAILLLWSRARLLSSSARLARVEERALSGGALEGT